MPFAVVGGIINAMGAQSAADTQAASAQQAAQIQQQALGISQANSSPYRQAGAGALGILSQMYGIPYDYGQSMPQGGGYGTPGSNMGMGTGGFLMGPNGQMIPGLMARGGFGGAGYNPPPGSTMTGATGGGTPNYSAFFNSPGYQFAQQQGQQAINRSAAASGNLYSSNTLANLANYSSGLASQQYNNYVQQLFGIAGLGGSSATAGGSQAITGANNIAGTVQNIGNAEASGIQGVTGQLSNLANNNQFQNTIQGWFGNPSGGSSSNGFTGNASGNVGDPFA